MKAYPRIRKMAAWLLLAGSFGWVAGTAHAALDISETPLFLTIAVPSNVVVTLDDSGSMARSYTPDICGATGYACTALSNRWPKSSHANPMYYNPAITYLPPLKADGTELSTSFTAAYINGFDPAWGTPVNLGTEYRPTSLLDFPNAADRKHEYMAHFLGDLTKTVTTSGTHTDNGRTNATGSAPYFDVTDFEDQDGSASGSNPGSNLTRVRLNGNTMTYDGTFTGACGSSTVGSNGIYKTKIVGTTLTLCFRNRSSYYNQPVEVIHKAAAVDTVVSVAANEPTSAYYYVYDPTNSYCGGTKTDNDCYDIVTVGPSSGPGGTDERQNFANWYSFYRTRNLATISAASRAFQDFDPTTRVAWQALNSCTLVTSDCEGWETTSTNFSNAIKPFTGTHKANFYKWLFRLKTDSSTPLRAATMRAGEYFSNTSENYPYDDDLDNPGSGKLSCRKNFHILMTDGVWNESTSVPSSISSADNALAAPYKGATSSTLADIAYHYWATDLAPSLANNLLPYMPAKEVSTVLANANPRNDPAKHQHMVNFTVGLGLGSFLSDTGLTWGGDTYSGSFIDISGGTKSWPAPSNNDDNNVSDLWHAAINSRGKFYNADDTQALTAAFSEVLDSIRDAEPSAAALAANSTSLEGGAYVYQATFISNEWSGDLKAYFVDSLGNVSGSESWTASANMPGHASRNIFTFNGTSGVPFTWGSSAPLTGYLNTDASGATDSLGEKRLNWLRGDRSLEQTSANPSGIFRERTSVLGDIINSDPAYAHKEDHGYATMGATHAETSTYTTYVLDKATRTPAVFVGANDGMLHAFKADTSATAGKELFAFVPNGVYANLSKLTAPGYSHKYFVDAGPTVGDAYFGGSWKTMLVGGLGGGGKSIYALDVSNVASPSASMVKWEYTEADMGLTYSKPQIVRLNNGDWAAVFGNGFNSPSDKAFLYIVNIGTGTLIKKIPVGPSFSANGLSTPVLYDATGDKIMDFAYVGDLQGHLWKIDLSSSSVAEWGVAYSGAPLFTARNASGAVQPIHGQPVIGSEPVTSDPAGVMVYFGTGQYLESDDVADDTVQSFYGIWDKGVAIASTDRSGLLQQTIEATTSEFGEELRRTSNNSVDDITTKYGWYMDFDTSAGERIVTQALLRYDRVIFLTLIPSTDVCSPDGESWLMELDAMTGSRTLVSSFDFSGAPTGGSDGKFDDSDLLASGVTASGIKTTVGITKTPAWFTGEGGKDFKVLTGTSGGIQSIGNKGAPPPSPGGTFRRTYWLQIQ